MKYRPTISVVKSTSASVVTPPPKAKKSLTSCKMKFCIELMTRNAMRRRLKY